MADYVTTVVSHLILSYIHVRNEYTPDVSEIEKKDQNDPGLCQALQNFGGRGKSNNKKLLRLMEGAVHLILISTQAEASRYALFFIESIGGIKPKF